MNWPVYVPSKGRAGALGKAILELPRFTLVVEPQDARAYKVAYPDVPQLVLPESERGLAFVRNFILRHAETEACGWFWMLDDDVSRLYRTEGRRNVPCSPEEALGAAEALVLPYERAAQAALEYQQYAWSAARTIRLNSYCDVCVAIHAPRASCVVFRPETDLKVDRDFTLQLLAAGYDTVRVCSHSFAAPKNGSNPGGLATAYAQAGREAASSRTMARLWPGVCEVMVKKDGRVDAKVRWERFQPRGRVLMDQSL